MAYRIKRVDGTDDEIADELTWLHRICFDDNTHIPDFEEGYWWMAYDAGREPVAFCGMRQSQQYSDVGYLSRAGVLPEHRGQGLQVRLLRVREQQAKRNGWCLVRTDTTLNPPSANSLINAGYKTFTPTQPWAFPESIYWRKELV
jgi:GNAT superfamily N-acetyltransferase